MLHSYTDDRDIFVLFKTFHCLPLMFFYLYLIGTIHQLENFHLSLTR